jgi:hypothetical protein
MVSMYYIMSILLADLTDILFLNLKLEGERNVCFSHSLWPYLNLGLRCNTSILSMMYLSPSQLQVKKALN